MKPGTCTGYESLLGMDRRRFLERFGMGLGSIALTDLLPEALTHSHDKFKLSSCLLLGTALAAGIELLPGHSHDAASHGPTDSEVSGEEDSRHSHPKHGHAHDHGHSDEDHGHADHKSDGHAH